jgi:hydrogenase maturation protein HypF
MSELSGARIHISGIVQGVGFRPFVYGLANRFELTGWVRNTSAGVDIEVDGREENLKEFARALQEEIPPLARIDEFIVEQRPANGFMDFEIVHSEPISGAFQPISPDVSICPDCLRELFDPNDRRYRYPFINCTNCGPRFTIIQDIPYDRPKTTMASFPMCPDCASEYANPLDRRFHAQPVACPTCGPQVWLEASTTAVGQPPVAVEDEAIRETQRLLNEGEIVAIKGLGGFHLACDATNAEAVSELRQRKLRVDKPFALMMLDLETIEQNCYVSDAERQLLESRQRPIVILKRRPGSTIAPEVAPHQDTVGVMLPYTPLHYLLFSGEGRRTKDGGRTTMATQSHDEERMPKDESQLSSSVIRLSPVLVMTSGNLSEEPIATGNEEARERLSALADAFLLHNRDIHIRCDDSVVRIFTPGQPSATSGQDLMIPLRRSRGYTPFPVLLPWEMPPLLATGAELKNTFCITHDRYAFLSHHIGDLENFETLQSFEEGISHFERLFRVQPQGLAYDLHPNYLSTRYALERASREGLPAIGVQHHYAHIAACMAENGLDEQPVIGVAFDGTGYGEDGAIWGGEFLIADYSGYQRAAHLSYVPLPGGDTAIRKPARAALAYLWQAALDWEPDLPSVSAFCAEERTVLRTQLEHQLNAPLTSSMGRLFDAAAALVGIRQKVNYEAQAAIEFEACADPNVKEPYRFNIPELEPNHPYHIDPGPLVQSLVTDYYAGVPVSTISARFHNGVATMVFEVCRRLKQDYGIKQVALSGGVWQNITLLGKAYHLLTKDGFDVYIHSQVPTNDGGISLGQVAIAAHHFKSSIIT